MIKNILYFIGIVVIIMVINYFPYSSRRSFVKAQKEFDEKYNLKKIFWLKEMHYNPWDHILEDSRDYQIISVQPESFMMNVFGEMFIDVSLWPHPDNSTFYIYKIKLKGSTAYVEQYDASQELIGEDEVDLTQINGNSYDDIFWQQVTKYISSNEAKSLEIEDMFEDVQP